jgi:hypothetical protein
MRRSSLVLLGVVFGVVPALAQVPDHLKCYKVKDSLAKAEYTADLGGLAAESDCLIKTPAKMLCVETAKTNVTPAPPGAAPGSAAGSFACYKVKCAKGPKLPVTIDDQFGSRAAEVIGPKLLCAPANVGPTTTTSATSTTTSTSTTTTTPGPPGCCYLNGGMPGCLCISVPQYACGIGPGVETADWLAPPCECINPCG